MSRLSQIGRFCLGGGAGVIVYYATLTLLTEIFGIWYIASAVVAWVLNYCVNFTIQKFWTFRNMDRQKARHQLVLYFAMSVGFLVIGTPLLYALVEWGGLPYLGAQVLLTITLSVASYFVTRRIFATPAT